MPHMDYQITQVNTKYGAVVNAVVFLFISVSTEIVLIKFYADHIMVKFGTLLNNTFCKIFCMAHYGDESLKK